MVKNLVIASLAVCLLVSLAFHLLAPDRGDPPPVTTTLPQTAPETLPETEPEPVPEPDPLLGALAAIFDGRADDPRFAGAAIGFCLVGDDGETLFERSGKVALIPASSLKTLTTATALEVLGGDFRFETRLGTSAPKSDDPANPEADLVLLGGGDPMLSPGDLEKWAGDLAAAGATTIPGRVVGDGRAFPGSPFADFWNWGDIGNGYGSPVSGLNLGHNRFTAVLAPGGEVGDPVQLLGTFPEVPGVSWWNEAVTAAEGSGDGIVVHGGERATVMHLRGTVPLGAELEVTGAVPDPERFAAHHLRAALEAAGVLVKGEAIGAGELFLKGEPVPEIAKELLVHRSPPLLDIVRSIHDTSDNHETECLYRTLGRLAGQTPDEVIRTHWRQRGLELTGLRLVDGSGLARADHITPETLARIQHFAASGKAGEEYVASLMTTGEGRIQFKAGAMSSIRSYAGLCDRGEGSIAFALIVNHYPDAAAVRELQMEVFQALLEGAPDKTTEETAPESAPERECGEGPAAD